MKVVSFCPIINLQKSNLRKIKNENLSQPFCDTVNFTCSCNFKLDFEKEIENCERLYPGEIRKMQKGKWFLLPEYGVTFELADVEKLNTRTKFFQNKLKKLKNNQSLLIGRGDFPGENRFLSRKHLEFVKHNENVYVRDLSTNGTKISADGVYKNFNSQYLWQNYSDNPDFLSLINKKYSLIRKCRYSSDSTFTLGVKQIQDAIDAEVESGYKINSNDWVYRLFHNMSYKSPKVIQRMSLNVVADGNLLKELDKFFATGTYVDKKGRLRKISNIDSFDVYYKTPAKASGWINRHDPITIYSQKQITKEFYEAIVEITRKYKRISANNIPLQGSSSSNYWVSVENEPNVKDIYSLIKRAKNIDKNLGYAVYLNCFNSNNEPIVSTGKFSACKIVVEEYEEFLNQSVL